jgi:anti-anti-sigma regulatory factor
VGLAALIDAQRHLRTAGGDLIITGAQALVRRALEITALVERLNLVRSRREAIERAMALRAAAP